MPNPMLDLRSAPPAPRRDDDSVSGEPHLLDRLQWHDDAPGPSLALVPGAAGIDREMLPSAREASCWITQALVVELAADEMGKEASRIAAGCEGGLVTFRMPGPYANVRRCA